MTVLAIDPGPVQSAWVLWDGAGVIEHGKQPNEIVIDALGDYGPQIRSGVLVFEEIASYGMPVGAEVFQTVRWTGRMEQYAYSQGWCEVAYMPRRDVKLHLCGQVRAKDANIRQALIDRFGGKEKAIGKKAAKGPLYGLKADEWQALALAVTWFDLHAVSEALAVK